MKIKIKNENENVLNLIYFTNLSIKESIYQNKQKDLKINNEFLNL
jgi:hypothetical protein